MKPTIDKNMVELYVLGVLPDSAKRRVEESFDVHPQVQQWFVELGELPDHLEEANAREAFEREALHFRHETSNAADRLLFAMAELVGRDDEPTVVVPAALDAGVWRGETMVMDFTQAVAGGSEQQPTYTPAFITKKRYGQNGNDIFIRCDASDIPHGLCRIDIHEADGTVTRYFPKLDRLKDRWIFGASIREILGGREPCEPRVRTVVVSATEENAAEFQNDDVRLFVKSLPAGSPQRVKADEFLDIGRTSDE